ncbi:MAG: acetate--CoA ligase family protein [Deltaproteobacteria bacterium]|nr:acetate--CoA ligase family protein [Deltaproteobacteria bacterium]
MLKNFFEPKSVVVLGASATPGKVGYDVTKNLIKSNYRGEIFPVNPKASEIQGLRAYPSILDINEDIDLLIYIIPPRFILETLDDCKKKNIDSIIAVSAGFKETGSAGAKIEREMLIKAKEMNIRILGPNCLGLIDTSSCLNATFAPRMPSEGNIAFFSQSGALCIAILDWALGEGIGFSKFISLGNKSDLGEIDFLKYLADDESTKVILGYLEGIEDGRAFMRVAREVSKKKPVIITKSGGTSAGAKAASSHTGSLAGSEKSIKAAFHQAGIIRADTVNDLFNYALAFACQPIPKGSRIAILSNSGGPGIMAADAIEQYKLNLASFSRETQEQLRSSLPTIASIYNPVDIIGDADADRYHKSLELIINDPNVDGVLVILTPTAVIDVQGAAEKVANLSSENGKPVLASFMGKVSVEKGIKVLQRKKVPNYNYPESAIKVFRIMSDYQNWLNAPDASYQTFQTRKKKVEAILARTRKKSSFKLGELEAREVISSYGFKTPKSILALTSKEALIAAEEIGYPLVMKIVSPDILHKTDVGGVRVGIENGHQVEEAFLEITSKSKQYVPRATILGVSIQEMIKGGKEVILGVTKDPQFGPLIMFGLGGIYVEVLKDVSFRIAPLSVKDADEMIREIHSFPLLRGVRGERPTDLNALRENLLRLSQLVIDFPDIIELDINPLIVKADGEGAIAADARITLEEG